MDFKFLSLVILPFILFGCTAYHFYHQHKSENRFNSQELPQNIQELDEQAREFFGHYR